jgi:hypothetical protein
MPSMAEKSGSSGWSTGKDGDVCGASAGDFMIAARSRAAALQTSKSLTFLSPCTHWIYHAYIPAVRLEHNIEHSLRLIIRALQ